MDNIAMRTTEMTKEEVEAVFDRLGIIFFQEKEGVYRVLNPEHEICIGQLQSSLFECAFIYTNERVDKTPQGNKSYARIYYIFVDNFACRFNVQKNLQKTLDKGTIAWVTSYKYSEQKNGIDTVFGGWEI